LVVVVVVAIVVVVFVVVVVIVVVVFVVVVAEEVESTFGGNEGRVPDEKGEGLLLGGRTVGYHRVGQEIVGEYTPYPGHGPSSVG
jgi:hypothetical protein